MLTGRMVRQLRSTLRKIHQHKICGLSIHSDDIAIRRDNASYIDFDAVYFIADDGLIENEDYETPLTAKNLIEDDNKRLDRLIKANYKKLLGNQEKGHESYY